MDTTLPVTLADAVADVGRLFAARLPIDDVIVNVARDVAHRATADCLVILAEAGGPLHLRGLATSDVGGLAGGEAAYAGLTARLATIDLAHAMAAPWAAARGGDATVIGEAGSPELDPVLVELGGGPLLAVPLRKGPGILGLLVALRRRGAPAFSAFDLAAFSVLAAEVARGLTTASLLAEERWQRQKAELMFQASKAIHTELQFDQAVREIALLVKQSIKAPWVGWLELRPEREELVLMGSTFAPAIDLRLAARPLPIAGWSDVRAVFLEPLRLTRVTLPEPFAGTVSAERDQAWALPLSHKRTPLGVLVLTSPPGTSRFGAEAEDVAVAIAELMALALSNHHLIEEEARARMQIIRAQAAAQEREVLLRQIVHDLRNATQAMSLVVEDLEIGIHGDPQVQRGLDILNNQITFISNFLKEKLTWMAQGERPGAGNVARLTQVFAAMEDRFGPAARAKTQRLIVSPPEAVDVAMSSVQLEQVLGNLLDNAIKFTRPHGEVRLRADVSDGWVTIYVADTGPGIPAEVRPHLGEVGQRGDQSVDGAGLGLANVRQLVTRAGGLFGCTSSDLGTTFHVSLPTTLWGRVIS